MIMFHPFPDDRAKAIERAHTYIHADPLFLDTETTGLSDRDEICEIAVINLAGEVLIDTLVKPTKPIDHNTSQIHGITNEMVKDAPTFGDLLPRLEQVLRGREVLVYNLEFDMNKIAQSARANGCGFADGDAWYWSYPTGEETPEGLKIYRRRWHCAMELYAMYYGDFNDYHENYRWQRLTNAALQCGIELPLGIHRAHADAELTRRVMLHVAEQGKNHGGG
jgi:DNA polymerase-3 subunit epsilon